MRNTIIISVLGLILLSYLGCTTAFIDESGTTPPIDGIIKYNPHIEDITFNHCITCHGGAAPSGGIDLSTYQNVRFYIENGGLIDAVNSTANPMPPSGLLPQGQRELFMKWMDDGFLEN